MQIVPLRLPTFGENTENIITLSSFEIALSVIKVEAGNDLAESKYKVRYDNQFS